MDVFDANSTQILARGNRSTQRTAACEQTTICDNGYSMTVALDTEATSGRPVAPDDTESCRDLERVYRDHHVFVWRSLRRFGVDDGGIEDAVQEVFLVVHRRLPEFEFRASLRTWLFRISMRVAQAYRRARAKQRVDELSTLPDPTSPAEHKVARRQALSALDTLLAGLCDEQRAAYVMAEVWGFSGPEMAECLGVELNTAYSRLRLARTKMARAFRRMAKQNTASYQ